jgi:putative flippase GtrA
MNGLDQKIRKFNSCDKNQLVIQFVKFGLVGISNTFVSWLCYYFILWINADLYILGSIIGSILSIANAFFWNDHFVFKNDHNKRSGMLKRLIKTYISYGGTTLFSMILLWVEVSIFHLNKKFAPPVNLIITIPINFILNKFWAFKDKENR